MLWIKNMHVSRRHRNKKNTEEDVDNLSSNDTSNDKESSDSNHTKNEN